MQSASDAMDFELAAVYRDRLKALTFIQGSQAINAEGLGDADIFAMASKGGSICIQAFFIRGGQNWGSEEHTSELQSLMRISYAVFCLKKKKTQDLNKIH